MALISFSISIGLEVDRKISVRRMLLNTACINILIIDYKHYFCCILHISIRACRGLSNAVDRVNFSQGVAAETFRTRKLCNLLSIFISPLSSPFFRFRAECD